MQVFGVDTAATVGAGVDVMQMLGAVALVIIILVNLTCIGACKSNFFIELLSDGGQALPHPRLSTWWRPLYEVSHSFSHMLIMRCDQE